MGCGDLLLQTTNISASAKKACYQLESDGVKKFPKKLAAKRARVQIVQLLKHRMRKSVGGGCQANLNCFTWNRDTLQISEETLKDCMCAIRVKKIEEK